jgi:hypothetical protein
MTGQAPRNARDRLATHADGVELGPVDPYEWLCGFIYDDPTPAQRQQFKILAERIEQSEPAAVDLLQPDNADQDPPASMPDLLQLDHAGQDPPASMADLLQPDHAGQDPPANMREQGDGIALEDLGRHAGAARWAIRSAATSGWLRACESVPTRAARKKRMTNVLRKTKALLGELRTLEPRDYMALQQTATDIRLLTLRYPNLGRARPQLLRWLPARPDLDGEGTLATMLGMLADAAEADLRRLSESGPARWKDLQAGVATGWPVTAAHDAMPIWLHFRRDRRPTSHRNKKPSREGGSFVELVEYLHFMASGKTRDVKTDVLRAFEDYAEAIDRLYGPRRGASRPK